MDALDVPINHAPGNVFRGKRRGINQTRLNSCVNRALLSVAAVWPIWISDLYAAPWPLWIQVYYYAGHL